MARILALIFIFLLPSLGTLARADPPGRVARLNYAAGAVSFAPAQAPEAWTQAVHNRPLSDGDRLWAGDTGRAELHIGSLALRLAPLTSVDVLHLHDDIVQLRLAQGALNVRVRELDAGEIIEIATPTGAVLLRQPGSYRVSIDPHSDVSRVLVHYGQAEVVTPFQTVTVPSSQLAEIPSGGGIGFEVVSQASMDEFDRWSAERDRREDRVASARYVSRDMTGYEDLDTHGTWRTLPDYGAVWVPTRVASGWAPYRHGHWSWIAPWGWTWIDDAPWGFAPSHYGRWVWVNTYWAWAPGRFERRPVYAPALVAFIGGSDFHVAIGSGPAVGWFPLGWGETYRPWYRASPTHVRRVNITHVANITHITNVNQYVYRNRREAVTVVPQQTFVSARPVARSSMNISPAALSRAEILRDRSPAEPGRASFAAPRSGQRPPAQTVAREVLTVTTPATTPARDTPRTIERAAAPSAANVAPSNVSPPSSGALERERRETRAVGISAPQGAAQSASPPERRAQPTAERDATAPRSRGADNPRGRTESSPSASLPSAIATPAVPAAPAVIPPAAATRPPAVVRAPETPATPSALPPAGADSERRNARREGGPRDEAPRGASGERRERPPATIAREAPQQMQAPVAVPQARIEREAPRARVAPATAPTVAAPASRAEPAQAPAPQQSQQSQRREERGREAGSRPGREGAASRGSRDG